VNSVRRRRFLIASGALLALPGLTFAQSLTRRIAILYGTNPTVAVPYQKVFFSRLAELGYREGSNLAVERRFAEGYMSRLPALAMELVALFVVQGNLGQANAPRIMEFANGRKLPVVSGTREHVELGGLMTYWSNTNEYFRDAADQVAKILNGAKPADLPVQQVRTFELLINLKAAKALGITVPQSLLLRADRVIE